MIYNTTITPGTNHMLLFLNFILPKPDRINSEFQSEYFRLASLFTKIMGMFVRDEVVANKKLFVIDQSNDSLYKDISEMILGGRCATLLIKEPLEEQDKWFRLDCRKILEELCLQVRKRFTFNGDSALFFVKNR